MHTILIAEDDAAARKMVGGMVSSMGLVPILCRDGLRAWETFQDNPDIALVITDVQMPNMDGRQLIQQLRAVPERADLPVLIMSAVVGPREIADLLERGATAFLPKPVSYDDVSEYVARSLDWELSGAS